MEHKIDRQIGAASAVMRSVYWTVVMKKGRGRKPKFSIYYTTLPLSPTVMKFG